jgi:hypothetical protein
MDRQDLMRKAMASLASIGDVYTDARECAGSVAAAQNLATLARFLSADTELVAKGILRASADGVCDDVCEADVRADGSLLVDVPSDYDTSGKIWTLATSDGGEFLVGLFVGVAGDDDQWVVEDAESFYEAVLRNPEPLAAPSGGPRP